MQSARVGEYTIYFENAEEFRILKREIFTEHCYYTELETDKPKILDLGGNIGLSTLYFKKLYPGAEITVVEPFPANVRLLRKNVEENQLLGVTIVEAAVMPAAGKVELYADKNESGWYSMAGVVRGGWGGQQESKRFTARAVTLESLVGDDVDLLKMDIEGAEEAVLRTSEGALKRVRKLVMEWHSVRGREVGGVVRLLEKSGFEVEIQDIPGKEGEGLKIVRANRVY